MLAARAFAILHTCTFDAWAAYDDVAVGTRLGALLRQPAADRTTDNKARAVSFAAYRALVDLFPSQREVLFDPLMARLGFELDESSPPAVIGRDTCMAVLEFRHADGSNQLGDVNGGSPYSDYTGYVPLNGPDPLLDPNRWPLRNPNGAVQVFLAPHWGLVTPFALGAADRLRPDPPAPFGSHEYLHQAKSSCHDDRGGSAAGQLQLRRGREPGVGGRQLGAHRPADRAQLGHLRRRESDRHMGWDGVHVRQQWEPHQRRQ
jgi:hypothetical protein